MAGRYAGKTIVVTGSGKRKGLGQAILQRFADDGANCVVSDLTIDAEAEAVAADLRGRGAAVATIACDVSQADQCQRLIDQAAARFGAVDILVNNAGIGFMMKPFLEVDPANPGDIQRFTVEFFRLYYGPTGNQRDEVTLIRRRGQEVTF